MAFNKRPGGFLCAVLGAVSWGFSGTCSQYLFMNYDISSVWLTTMRMFLSGVVLLLMCLFGQRKQLTGLLGHRRDMLREVVFALAGLMFVQLSYLTAIQYSNSATATVMQNLSVAIIAVVVAIRTRTMLSGKHLFSVFLALLGVFLIATHGNVSSMVISGGGLFWGICAAVGVVTYSMLSAGLVVRWGSQAVSAYGMLIGGGALGICSGSFGKTAALDGVGILVMILIILIGTVGAFTLFLQGISEIGAVKATLIGCLEPVSATIISALWLHSRFELIDLLGFACILVTVFLFNMGGKSEAGEPGAEETETKVQSSGAKEQS